MEKYYLDNDNIVCEITKKSLFSKPKIIVKKIPLNMIKGLSKLVNISDEKTSEICFQSASGEITIFDDETADIDEIYNVICNYLKMDNPQFKEQIEKADLYN